MKRTAGWGALALVLGLLAWYTALNMRGISEDTLAQRIISSTPRWNSYQEDIKAQIGAAQVAQWNGRPIEAVRDTDSIVVTFTIEGPWTSRALAIPVLLRDPLGNTLRETRVEFDSGLAHYTFYLAEDWVTSEIPWVDLHYPHNELRIVFRRDDTWRRTGDNK